MEQEEEAQRHDTRGGGSGRGRHSIRLLLLPFSGLSRVGFFSSLPPPSAAEPFLCKPGLSIKQEGGGEGKSLEEGRGKGPSWFNKGINQPPFPSSLSLLPSPLSRP